MKKKTATSLLIALLGCGPGGAQAGSQAGPGRDSQTEPEPVRLSLRQAVDLALAPAGSARVQLAGEAVRQAHSQSALARAALLPGLDAGMVQQNQTRNLEAFGIGLVSPAPNLAFPTFVGPFSTFDARVSARQSLLDLGAIRRFQASRAGLDSAEAERQSVEDQAVGEVARLYLGALRAQALLDEAKANLKLSEALLELAAGQKDAGTGTGIEVTRARVQLADSRQRRLVAENELSRAHLQLARAAGIDLGARLELTDRMDLIPAQPMDLAQALSRAWDSRCDWKARQARLQSARLSHRATRAESLPTVGLFGDYGSIGLSVDNSVPTRTYGLTVRIPLWDGGARAARRAQSLSQVRQEEVRTADLRAEIELEVRLALDSLRSSGEQVRVAQEGLSLAVNELEQARRRYQAGVSTGLEVTDAQTRMERAQGNRISALFQYNVARIQLAIATGTVRETIQ